MRFRWFFPACSLTTLGMPSRLKTNCSLIVPCLYLPLSLFSSLISTLRAVLKGPFSCTEQAFVQLLHIFAFLQPGICIVVWAVDPPHHVAELSVMDLIACTNRVRCEWVLAQPSQHSPSHVTFFSSSKFSSTFLSLFWRHKVDAKSNQVLCLDD